ncbi:MAG: CHRD domain-containing protein [Comamonadaceae bacterium]|nr:CHRD domain-containing protein [Comamonadaceae bacterium]
MPTPSHSVTIAPSRWRATGALSLAALLAACSTVDLGPRYDPPPVRMPGSAEPPPPAAMPQPLPPPQSQPVPPAQPVPQPLPPAGQTDPADPNAHIVTFTTRLDGASAIPPARSGASGQLDAIYNAHTRLLRWKASWNGLSGPITGVAFYGPAHEGQVGPATMIWPAPFGPRYEGRATLTPQQAADLLQGSWYLGVTTQAYPAGEIRGQVRMVR